MKIYEFSINDKLPTLKKNEAKRWTMRQYLSPAIECHTFKLIDLDVTLNVIAITSYCYKEMFSFNR